MGGSERRSVKRHLEELDWENRRLREEDERLEQKVERLRRQLEEALRAAQRQAAPFSRGQPKAQPKPPGRKADEPYGRRGCRLVPRRVNERVAVPLPPCYPACAGAAAFDRRECQYQEGIVGPVVVRRFDVAVGRCRGCGRRAQGRRPLQTSEALGAARVQLGPEALAPPAWLNRPNPLARHSWGQRRPAW